VGVEKQKSRKAFLRFFLLYIGSIFFIVLGDVVADVVLMHSLWQSWGKFDEFTKLLQPFTMPTTKIPRRNIADKSISALISLTPGETFHENLNNFALIWSKSRSLKALTSGSSDVKHKAEEQLQTEFKDTTKSEMENVSL
jgi:hypothetical protein